MNYVCLSSFCITSFHHDSMKPNNLLPCLLGILVYFITKSVGHEAIVNGEEAAKHQLPYQVAIIFDGIGHICGGGVIADQHIITAAHCLLSKTGQIQEGPITIHSGSNDWKKPAVIGHVEKIFLSTDFHLNYDSFGDIAVLKLKKPLKHRHVRQLELPKKIHENLNGRVGIIAGYGWNWVKLKSEHEKIEGNSTDSLLRFAYATVIPNNQCNLAHSSMNILDKHLCARVNQRNVLKPSGVCIGDSGGPLVVDGNTIIGIFSKGSKRCTDEEKPGIYTRVSEYMDLIEQALKDKQAKNVFMLELRH